MQRHRRFGYIGCVVVCLLQVVTIWIENLPHSSAMLVFRAGQDYISGAIVAIAILWVWYATFLRCRRPFKSVVAWKSFFLELLFFLFGGFVATTVFTVVEQIYGKGSN
jgi:hypothetical protein